MLYAREALELTLSFQYQQHSKSVQSHEVINDSPTTKTIVNREILQNETSRSIEKCITRHLTHHLKFKKIHLTRNQRLEPIKKTQAQKKKRKEIVTLLSSRESR